MGEEGMKSKTKLITANVGGNFHQSSIAVNKMELSDFVIAMDYSNSTTVVVFRVPWSDVDKVNKILGFKNETI